MKTSDSFFSKIYDVVREIPSGKVTTYGAIAKHIGSPQSARMVGWALNKSQNISPFVPAHRVVNRKGMLSGKNHFGGQHIMDNLLKSEGITIKNNSIVDFEKCLWDPGA